MQARAKFARHTREPVLSKRDTTSRARALHLPVSIGGAESVHCRKPHPQAPLLRQPGDALGNTETVR
jgi:hypothetical protein